MKLPATVVEMMIQFGPLETLEQVKNAQRQVSRWALDAAEERWGIALYKEPDELVCRLALEHACAKWDGFTEVPVRLCRIERELLLTTRPQA